MKQEGGPNFLGSSSRRDVKRLKFKNMIEEKSYKEENLSDRNKLPPNETYLSSKRMAKAESTYYWILFALCLVWAYFLLKNQAVALGWTSVFIFIYLVFKKKIINFF